MFILWEIENHPGESNQNQVYFVHERDRITIRTKLIYILLIKDKHRTLEQFSNFYHVHNPHYTKQ
jgi:hypothetical protein